MNEIMSNSTAADMNDYENDALNTDNQEKTKKKLRILLLTHKISDNIGDQMIEICDWAILHTVMKNLGYSQDEYEIISFYHKTKLQ